MCQFGYKRVCVCAGTAFFVWGSRALFTRPISTDFNKFFFKTKSHGIIHTFKNYFATIFSVFNNKWYPDRKSVV